MLGRASSAERSIERLAKRRRSRRRRVLFAFFVLCLVLLFATVYGLRQSAVRISHVEIFGLSAMPAHAGQAGADASLSRYVTDAMHGWYWGIIPRDSIFFFPEDGIRSGILAAHRNIAAVSIFRNGFTGLSLKVDTRTPIARWCGSATPPQAGPPEEQCYVFDASGFIYAAASSTQTVNAFAVYAPLDPARGGPPAASETEPLEATIADAEKLPAVFDFARELATLGSPTTRIAIHDGEVNDYLASGTRVTYVLGHEQDAFTALVSARENLNLSDGSLEYVDLRFDGKVYVKRK
ncbi:MAG: hypothetical protein UY97_C0008G0015 [Parcubacteria group bacterium GW2011_GWB1_57_6]|nr:MAG: hypothetical protein UY93_C0002G0340 [Parcubacteria group bacterium GW2011_GWA1_56_13]KKW46228.1 MAG: hypothetical protein UY97_C0008G0015 [Parcubacteria group bacterium GW2011_GWB1_57_6]